MDPAKDNSEQLDLDRPANEHDAPVAAVSSIEIAAPREIVWDVLADVAAWPDWNPAVKIKSVEERLEPGVSIRWTTRSLPIHSIVDVATRPSTLSWRSKTIGLRATKRYRIRQIATGTDVTLHEEWFGWPARLLSWVLAPALKRAVRDGLMRLKITVERRPT